MKLKLVEGKARHFRCLGCSKEGVGGTEPYEQASSGLLLAPDQRWYTAEDGMSGLITYCSECAAKIVYEDPTRSVSIFYADVSGTQIEPEHLE